MKSGTMICRPVSSFASFQDEFNPVRAGGAVSTTLSGICGGTTMSRSRAVEEQGFIFLVLLEKPTALAELFVANFELVESLDIDENPQVGPRVAVSNAASFHRRHGHALVLGEDPVNEAPGSEVAQAGVEAMPGLGGPAGVHVLNDVGGAVQHQDHLALEFGGQDRLHIGNEGCGALLFFRLLVLDVSRRRP